MRLLQSLLSGACFTGVGAIVGLRGDWGFRHIACVGLLLTIGVSLSADFAVWAHEARKHKEPR